MPSPEQKKQNFSTAISKLIPDDIVETILVKLPGKSLIRFKCVSKAWRDRISDTYFTSAHLQHNKEKSFIVAIDENGIETMVILDKIAGHNELTVKERLDLPSYVDYRFECSCNGVLCITKRPKTDSGEIEVVLLNPNIRKHKTLTVPKLENTIEQFGIGYDSSIDDYKVVKIIMKMDPNNFYEHEVEVLTIKSNKWRRVAYDLSYHINPSFTAVWLNEALHWLSSREQTDAITRFGLANEKFSVTPLTIIQRGHIIYGFSARGDKLCIASHDPKYGHVFSNIWVMEGETNWVKLFSISQKCIPISRYVPIGLCFIRDSVLIERRDEPGVTYYVDDVKLKKNEEVNLYITTAWRSIIMCANSLISFT